MSLVNYCDQNYFTIVFNQLWSTKYRKRLIYPGFLTIKLWEGVANAFRLVFSEFSLFCQKVNFYSDKILTFGIRSIYSLAKVEIGCYKAVNYQPGS